VTEPAGNESEKPTAYPPPHHIVRDLQVVVDRSLGDWAIRLPIVPAIADATGRPRVGVVAVIADMIAGQTAIREVSPAWIATSNLALQVGDLPTGGTLVGHPKVLRKGATTIVIEVRIEHAASDGPPSARPVGLSTLGFSILPRRNALQAELHRSRTSGEDTVYAPAGHGFAKPLLETIGARFDATDAGSAEVDLDPYLQNTLGALQGGVVAILVEAAAERLAAVALGSAVRVRGLELQYLKLGRKGPIRARARELARTAAGLIVRVELDDRGDGEALLTVATVWIDRA
jgi:acyl-coenzyme A thioesterase PaaI-like protein